MSYLDETGLARLWDKIKGYVSGIAPNGIVDIPHGGTGANTVAEARQNINFIGVNPIASAANDTPANWAAVGSGWARMTSGILQEYPNSQYGCVLENAVVKSGSVTYVSQKITVLNGYNNTYYRTGSTENNTWYTNGGMWVRSIDDNSILNAVYPVGAVYISYVSTSPAELFGGTWTAITGRFPYFNAGTSTGGSNTHTLTTAQMPSHNHKVSYRSIFSGSGGYLALVSMNEDYSSVSTYSTGGGESHNNMPAYQTLYAWRRTA